MAQPLIQMRGITKHFPGVVANDAVDLDLYAGEIHTLLGENGAGKTTLLNILSGIHHPDAGTIKVHGNSVRLRSPQEALAHGIGTVYQHFTLVPNLSVTENVVLGTNQGMVLKLKQAARRIREMMEKFGLHIDPLEEVQHLSLGQQQRVEIIKVLFREPEILLLDEPTSVLTPNEVEELFHIIRQLKAEGKGVVFITHKLHEALELSDRMTILLNGKRIACLEPHALHVQDTEATSNHIVKLMFGGAQPKQKIQRESRASGKIVLSIDNITVFGSRGVAAVRDLSLELRAGEIMGLAGVGGSGQKELAETIAGQLPVKSGRIHIEEVNLTNKGVPFVMKQGVAYITEDRIGEGTVADLSVAENTVIRIIDEAPMSKHSFLNWHSIFEYATKLIKNFDIKVHSPKTRAGTLSGGNVQKLLLARELSRNPKVLICNQPTQGLDVKTINFVWKTLLEQASQGKAIMLISSDLDEIFELSDRIGVMYNGKLLDVLATEETDREAIGRLMLGKTS